MEQYNDEIELKDILTKLSDYKAYLLKKRFLIISCSLIFLILGIVGGITSDKKYIAELTFVVEDPQVRGSVLGSMSGIANQFGFDMGGGYSSTFSQSNILQLLKSRRVVESAFMQKTKIADREDLLIDHYLRINHLPENSKKEESLLISYKDEFTLVHDSVISNIWRYIIEENLVIEMQSDAANIISLSFLSLNERFAKQFVEVLIDQMSKMYISHKTAQAHHTLSFLQERADSVFGELELAEEEYARIKDINQRIIKSSGRLKELQLMRRVEVLNTMYLEIVKNLELSKIRLLNNTPIINIIDKPILPLQDDGKSKTFLGFIGAFLGGFLSIIFFILRKLFKDALVV
jgi:hypothetical protein